MKAGTLRAWELRLRAPIPHNPAIGIAPDRTRWLEETRAQLDARALF